MGITRSGYRSNSFGSHLNLISIIVALGIIGIHRRTVDIREHLHTLGGSATHDKNKLINPQNYRDHKGGHLSKIIFCGMTYRLIYIMKKIRIISQVKNVIYLIRLTIFFSQCSQFKNFLYSSQ